MATVKSLTAAKKKNPEKFERVFKKVRLGGTGGKYSGIKSTKVVNPLTKKKYTAASINDARRSRAIGRFQKFLKAGSG